MSFDKQIDLLEAEMKVLAAKIEPLLSRQKKMSEEWRALLEARDAAVNPATLTIADFLRCQWNDTVAMHRNAETFFKGLGFWLSGYYPEIEERCLHLMAYKGRDGEVAKIVEAIKTVIPAMKGLKEDSGWLRFGVFEYTLSENGCYSFLVDPTGAHAKITVMRYHRQSEVLKECPLDEAVEYAVNNLYYEHNKS